MEGFFGTDSGFKVTRVFVLFLGVSGLGFGSWGFRVKGSVFCSYSCLRGRVWGVSGFGVSRQAGSQRRLASSRLGGA